MLTPDHLLWIDLETTGSDVDHDSIIEIGAILTTQDLDVLGEYQRTVTPTAEGLGRLIQNPAVRAMHEENGLLDEILASTLILKPEQAGRELLGWAKSHGMRHGKAVLAGSGVGHFDRKFIARYMPDLDRALRYYCLDIGVVRRAWKMWNGSEVSIANDGKTHRALDDIRCHLEEARAFAHLWKEDVPC